MNKIFLDANIILDMIDSDRGFATNTKATIAEYIKRGDILCTSCDIFTTVYYVCSKNIAKDKVIDELEKLLIFVDVLPIYMTTVKKALELAKNSEKSDLEDVLQYVCAFENQCSFIITNDSDFYKGDIRLINTKK